MSNSTMSHGFLGLKNFFQSVRNFFKRLLFVYWIIFGIGIIGNSVFSQNGPGGVGDWTTNKIWLKEDVYQSTSEFWWNDMSGNGNAFVQFSQPFMPTVVPAAFNGRQALRFNGSTQFLGTVTAPNLYNSSQYTSFIVLKPNGSGVAQLPFYNADGGANSGYYFGITALNQWQYGVGFGNSFYVFNGGPANTQANILTGSQAEFFINGNQIAGTPGTHAPNMTSNALIGKNSLGSFYNGDLAEVITFNYMLNTAERVIVENYLSSKYGITVAQDYYDDVYNHDVAGIGQININNSHNQSASNILNINSIGLTPNQWLFFGHNGAGLTKLNTTNVPGGIVKRLEQTWHVDITNASSLLCSLKIYAAEIPVSMWEDMRLIVDNDTDFTNGAAMFPPMMFTENELHFGNISLADGQYITLGTINPNNLIYDSLIVWNTAGSGPGSFAYVLNHASNKPGPDTVRFVLPQGSICEVNNDNTPTIYGDSTYIDADYGHDGIPDIMIYPATSNMNGLVINSSYNTITGLVITGFNPSMNNGAVYFSSGTHHNKISGCYIGTDMTGLTVPGNGTNMRGIFVDVGSHHNQIGDTTANGRNIISGNTEDALFFYNDSCNVVVNNVIGLNAAGETLGNSGNGIRIEGSLRNQIGNGTTAGRNIIGNNSLGIFLFSAFYNKISGNLIGLNESNQVHGNMNKGIHLVNSYYNAIGGDQPGHGNVISGTTETSGLELQEGSAYNTILGNFIGTDLTGNVPMGNNFCGINLNMGARNNTIGNGTLTGRNIIAANGSNGVNIEGDGDYSVDSNRIDFNYIGVGLNGVTPMPNFSGISVFSSGQTQTVTDQLIRRNTIAYNNGYGINLMGSNTFNHMIRENSIYQNALGGIILQSGAQDGILPPVIDSIKNNTVFGSSSNDALIQVFTDKGNQGKTFKGEVIADAVGQWQYTFGVLPFNVNITALQSVGTNTSAFSSPIPTPTDSLLVTSTSDDGTVGTLRTALDYANTHPGADTVKFALDAGSTITLQTTGLVIASDSVVVDGDINDDGTPDIGITSGNLNGLAAGLTVAGSHNLIKGLVIGGIHSTNGPGIGIEIMGSHNTVKSCYIGIDHDGLTANGNMYGIWIRNRSAENKIGDGTIKGRNVISGNDWGIYLYQSPRNEIAGNIVGLTTDGQSAVMANQWAGIYINQSDSNIIGSGTYDGRNIVSGHIEAGIRITHGNYNKIRGNWVGFDITGMNVIRNNRDGIEIGGGGMYNQIGDTTAGGRNVVAGSFNNISFHSLSSKKNMKDLPMDENSRELVFEVMYNKIIGNYIGTDITGQNVFPSLSEIQSGIVFDNTDWNQTNSKNYGNQIGGPTLNFGNVIAGCYDGIFLVNADSNFITNNWIGTNQSLNTDLGNAGNGIVFMDEHQTKTLQVNSIDGGSTKNLVSNNVVAFNDSVGLIAQDPNTKNNNFSYNRFYQNGRPVEIRNGAQWSINAPVIDSMNVNYTIFGTGIPNANIYIYTDSSAISKGRMYLATTTANGSGSWSVNVPYYAGWYYSAIQDTAGNTSEFSNSYKPFLPMLVTLPDTLLNFGNVFLGNYPTLPLTLKALNDPIEIDNIYLDGDTVFRIEDNLVYPISLNAGDSIVIHVNFNPINTTTYSGTINISNSSLINPKLIDLYGIGLPPPVGTLITDKSNVTFGDIIAGTTAGDEIKLTVSASPVIIDSIKLKNGAHYSFTPSQTIPFTIGLDDTLLLDVRFTPTDFANFPDTIFIFNNSSASPLKIGLSGTGIAGTLSASATNLNFGTRLVGDSADASVIFKASTGMVQISQITQGIGGAVDFKVASAPSVPRILHAGIDSMIVTMRFKPVSAGAKADTLKIYSNSSPGENLVYLSGTATVNQSPNAFALKSPISAALTNDRTPDFAWEGRGDPDNDALTYIIDVSKVSNFSSIAYRDTTADTTLTAESALDTTGTYYWRVTAYDGRGGSTVSNTGSFRIDAKPAVLTAGTFIGTVTKQYMSVNVISNKLMTNVQGKIVLRNATGVQIDSIVRNFDLKSASNRFYQMPYKLSETGRLYITVTGTDSAQNVTVVQKDYSVMWYMKQQSLAMISDDGSWQVTAPKQTIDEDGYLLVHELNSETVTVHEQSLVAMAKASAGCTAVNEGLSIQGSSAIREGQGLTVTMKYDEDVISELQTRYADYDERKIGMYAERNGEWMYIGGEGKNGQVQTKMKDYGQVKLMYNPEHEFLPTKVELAQNYPNPFNPNTTIRFGLPQESKVRLTIYNVLGQKVKELVNDNRSAGYHTMIWNGRSDNGHVVSSGVYLYRLETTQGTAVKKMIYIK